MALVYRTIYQGNFCTVNDAETNNTVYLQKRMDSGLPIPTPIEIEFTGDEPVILEYSDKGDYKLNGINGLGCTINLIAKDSFELSSLYTADEREWKVTVAGLLVFEGFLIPDSCSEPFANKPYPITIQDTDAIGTLEDIPFAESNGVTYKGFKSDINILNLCLAKTGLSLEMLVGVNTYEATMSTSLSPLEQNYIDCARFLDADGSPFGCLTVIESILNRWSARLHQFNGYWQIINVLEKSRGNVKAWEYTPIGESNSFKTLGNSIIAGGQNRTLRPADGVNETAKGFKSSTAYYQYGYPSNQLYNGDFNIAVPPALPTGWVVSGSATGASEYRINPETGLPTPDVIFKIFQNGVSNAGYFYNDTVVQIRKNQKATINFAMKIPAMGAGPDSDRYLDILIKDNLGKYYTADGWGATFGYYRITYRRSDFIGQVNVSFDVNLQDTDYQMTLGLKAITYVLSGTTIYMETQYNDVSVRPQTVSSLTTPSFGLFNRQTVVADQTYTKDPIRLLHGDELNTQRTSRILINNSTVPTTWKRDSITEATELLRIVSNTELRLHQRPYNTFEAKFVGTGLIDINTLLTIDLLSASSWIFLSGKFDLKTGYHTLRFAETLVDDPSYSDSNLLEDYGGEKDKNGVSVGQPSTAPPNPGGAISGGGASAATLVEVQAGTIADKYVSPLTLNVGNGDKQLVKRMPAAGSFAAGGIQLGAFTGTDIRPYNGGADIAYSSGLTGAGAHNFFTNNGTLAFRIDALGFASMPLMKSGLTSPTQSGTKHNLTIDADGLIGHEIAPTKASESEVITGSDDAKFVTPLRLKKLGTTEVTVSLKIPTKNSGGTVTGTAEIYIEV